MLRITYIVDRNSIWYTKLDKLAEKYGKHRKGKGKTAYTQKSPQEWEDVYTQKDL